MRAAQGADPHQHTNPILDEDSPQRVELTRAGIELAYDGMLITNGDKA
jgi:pyrroloquinoline quinone biosynthesis protein B